MPVRKRLALVGSNGMLAAAVRKAAGEGWEQVPLDLPGFDMTDLSLVEAVLGGCSPTVIINCAAYTNVDGAEAEEALATRVNGQGPANLAHMAKQLGATLVHISTDYVFNGRKASPYLETDPVGPLSAYGRSKLAGEQAILASGLARYFIIRTSWLYGPGGRNFVETIFRLAQEREELRIVDDQIGSPTYTGDLAQAIFNLLALGRQWDSPHAGTVPSPYGIYHFANEGQCSWYEFAAAIVAWLKARGEPAKVKVVVPIKTEEYPLPAPRPAYSVFSKDKFVAATGAVVPEWQSSLRQYLQERSP